MIVVRVGLARERRSNRCSNRAPQICSDFVAVGLTPRNASQNWRDPGEGPSAEDAGVELDDITVKISQLLDEQEGSSADEMDGRPADQDVKVAGLGLDATT